MLNETCRYDSVKDDAIVVAALGQLSKVLAGLVQEVRIRESPNEQKTGACSWCVVPVEFQLNISHACFENDRVHGALCY
jgi:hypothetical protein